MISTRLLSFICFTAIVVSFFVQKNRSSDKSAVVFDDQAKQESSSVRSVSSVSSAPSKKESASVAAGGSMPSGGSNTAPGMKLSEADQHWQDQRLATRRYFSTLPTGIALAEITALSDMGSEYNRFAPIFDKAMSDVMSHPDDAMREINSSLDKIPDDKQNHRRYLIQIATKLDVGNEYKIELLQKDLAYQREYELKDNSSRFGTSMAFDALMDITDNRELLMSEARLLASQYKKSQGSRTALLRFANRYPAEAKQIKKELEK